jgi:hypothetical protein
MFFTKKNCMQNISHVYCDDVMNCKQVLSHIMFIYRTTCRCMNIIHTFIAQNMIDDCSPVKEVDFYFRLLCWGMPHVLKKIGCGLIFYVRDCPRFRKYSSPHPCGSFWREKTMTAPPS